MIQIQCTTLVRASAVVYELCQASGRYDVLFAKVGLNAFALGRESVRRVYIFLISVCYVFDKTFASHIDTIRSQTTIAV